MGAAITAGQIEITAKQRTELVKLFREDPYRPHVATARTVGIHAPAGDNRRAAALIRAALKADPEIQQALEQGRYEYLKQKRLGMDRLLDKLADVVDSEGPSQLRGIQTAMGLHGVVTDRQRVEVTGEDGAPVEVETPDVSAAIDRFTATVARLADRAGTSAGTSGSVRDPDPDRPGLAAGPAGG